MAGRGMSASRAEPVDRARRDLSRDVVHQRQGSQGAVLRAVPGRRKNLLRSNADRPGGQGAIATLRHLGPARDGDRMEGIRRREDFGQSDDISGKWKDVVESED